MRREELSVNGGDTIMRIKRVIYIMFAGVIGATLLAFY